MNPALKEAGTERPVVDEAAAGGVMSTSPAVLGPMPCISCGERVKWVRNEGRWSLRDEDGEKHRCAA